MNPTQHLQMIQQLKDGLKSLLKKNKITYADLARRLQCSEPTVKRILGDEEITLSRLLQICEILNISMSDLDQFTQNMKREQWTLSEKQQQFLVENPHYFAFLFELYQELKPEDIAVKHKISPRSLSKYLIGLEKMDLIKVNSKQDVKPFSSAFPSLDDGPLGVSYFKTFINNAAAFFVDLISDQIAMGRGAKNRKDKSLGDDSAKGSKFSMQTHYIKPETYKKYMAEIERQYFEMEKTARFEEKTLGKENLKTCVISFGQTLIENNNPRLQRLDKMLGEVKEI